MRAQGNVYHLKVTYIHLQNNNALQMLKAFDMISLPIFVGQSYRHKQSSIEWI